MALYDPVLQVTHVGASHAGETRTKKQELGRISTAPSGGTEVTPMKKLVLASSSPRRRELLEQIGVSFDVEVADVDETPLAGESPQDYVSRLALAKARKVAQNSDRPCLGSDTSVVLNGKIFGKPVNVEDARAMLNQLSDCEHEVLSAVAIVQRTPDGERSAVKQVSTQVRFAKLSAVQIDAYIATGEPADKAGAYGIQGKGAVFVTGIQGSYSNVVGLPLFETTELLTQFDIPYWQ